MTTFGARTTRALSVPLRPSHNRSQKVSFTRAHIHSEPRYQAITYNGPASIEAAPVQAETVASHRVLSQLPTVCLWRSLLINAVSSRPWILIPSLKLLMKLSAPGNMFLFNIERNPLLRGLTKMTLYKQFCAGETPAETQETMRCLQDMGFKGTILTYAKETVFDHNTNEETGLGVETAGKEGSGWDQSIEAWREGTLKTVEILRDGDQLALKTTGAGPAVCKALAEGKPLPRQMCDALHEISQQCKDRGAYILIDAESQRYQWGIFRVGMDLQRKYNTGKVVLYNTYQAYLKSTQNTLAQHMQMANDEGFSLGIKVVRGAYMGTEPRELIQDTKEDTDRNYNTIAQGVLRRDFGNFSDSNGACGKPFPSAELLLASHNEESLIAAHKLHRQRKDSMLPTVPVKFAQLHGMSDAVSFGLLKLRDNAGMTPEVYKCSTWGPLGECMAYLTRRGMENKDAASRTSDEYAALKSEAWRRMAFWK